MKISHGLILGIIIGIVVGKEGDSKGKGVSTDFLVLLGAYSIKTKIGHPSTTKYFGVDITSPYTAITNSIYDNYTKSKTVCIKEPIQVTLMNNKEKLEGTLIEEKIIVGNQTIFNLNNFSLIISRSNNDFNGKNAILALAYNISDHNQSIVYQMKNQRIIDYNSFTIFQRNRNDGTIYFGTIPSDIFKDYSKVSITVKGKTNGTWDFALSHIFLNEISFINPNIYYHNTYPAYFTALSDKIFAPKAIYEMIIHHLFDDCLSKKTCQKNRQGHQEMYCNDTIKVNFPLVSFIINGYVFSLTKDELFDQFGYICIFKLVLNTDGDEWNFGTEFLKKYIPTFDYEKKRIFLHSQSKIEEIDIDMVLHSRNISKIVFMICGMILLGVIIYYLIRRILKRKNVKNYDIIIPNTLRSIDDLSI